jgi:hypothetical protein
MSAQVALAWLISLPNVVAIPGASSVEQLEFNVGAADIELSTQSRGALTDAARAFRPVSTLDYFSERIQRSSAVASWNTFTRGAGILVRGAGAAVCSGGNQKCAFSS